MAAAKALQQHAPRRQWPLAEKRRIVELTLRAGVPVRAIAREQGVHRTSLSHWRTLYRAGKLGVQSMPRVRDSMASATFVPVSIVPAERGPQPVARPDTGECGSGVVHLMFAS